MLRRNGPPPVAAGERARTTHERPLSHSTPVYIPDGTAAYAGTRRVGTWRRDGQDRLWLHKGGLDPKRHMLRHPKGWCTAVEHIQTLERDPQPGGVRLECIGGDTYSASLASFQQFPEPLDRGFGPQRFVPLDLWEQDGRGQQQLGLFDLGAAS